MKLAIIVRRSFCAFVITMIIVGATTPPLARAVGLPVTPNQETDTTIYLPLVTSPLQPIIPATTNVLTDATNQFLTSVSNDGTFIFSQMTPELNNVAPGEVIVGGINATAPYGFLRAVTSISRVGKQVIIQTTAATLEDAVEQAELHISGVLSPITIQTTRLANGVTLAQQETFSFEFKIKDVVLHDADGNQQTTQDQVRANGSINLDSDYDFDLIIQDGKLERLNFINMLKRTTKLSVETKVDVSLIKKKVEIARHIFAPVTVFIPSTPPVPVVVTPVLIVEVGVDGSIYVGVTAGITQQTTLTAGVTYQNRTWAPVSEYTNDLQYTPPTLSPRGFSVTGNASTQLTLLLYGVAGPYAELKAYLKLEVEPAVTPWWKLFAGLQVPIGVKVEIFSHTIAEYQAPLLDYQRVLAEAKDGIVFASQSSAGAALYVMNSDIGTSRKVSSLKSIPGLAIQCPTWSPNGEQIGFLWSTGGAELGDIYIVNSDGTHLRNSTNKPDTYDNPAWSPNGTMFAYGTLFSPFRLVGIDSSNSWQIKASGDDKHPDWSPDGNHLVFDSNSDLFVINIDGTGLQQLTNNSGWDSDPSWSPDGSRIAFVSTRDGDSEIFVMNTDESNIQQLTSNPAYDRAPTWSPDSLQIAFVTDRDSNDEIYIMNADGSNQRNITNSPANEYCPDWFGVR